MLVVKIFDEISIIRLILPQSPVRPSFRNHIVKEVIERNVKRIYSFTIYLSPRLDGFPFQSIRPICSHKKTSFHSKFFPNKRTYRSAKQFSGIPQPCNMVNVNFYERKTTLEPLSNVAFRES